MKALARIVLACIWVCCPGSWVLWAQQEKPYALRVEVTLVNLDVAVVDARGQFIAGLERRNFRVLEDDREQTITHFAPIEAPLTLVLLVETSPAVYLIRDEHLEAAHTLLDHLKPADAVALARYDQHWQPVADFTRDKAALRRHLQGLNYSLGMGELNLFDALARTLDWLAPSTETIPGRKAVLLIGTGFDTHSQTTREVLEKSLSASDVTLFAIATGRLLRGPPEKKSGRKRRRGRDPGEASALAEFEAEFTAADARLRGLAEETGGRAYFPRAAADLRAAYREIGERLRHTYSLGYIPPDGARTGDFRSVQIRLVGEDGRPLSYRVIARRGYFAPRD